MAHSKKFKSAQKKAGNNNSIQEGANSNLVQQKHMQVLDALSREERL